MQTRLFAAPAFRVRARNGANGSLKHRFYPRGSTTTLAAGSGFRPAASARRAGSTLVEAVLALSLVAFAFGGLFTVYSTGLGMIRAQQQTIHATLLLDQRCAALREANWTVLSDPDRLKQTLYQAASPSEAHLPQLVEEVRVKPYALAPPTVTPLTLRHEPGAAPVTVTGAPSSLASATCVRVDLRLSWTGRKGPSVRETSLVLALGGTGK